MKFHYSVLIAAALVTSVPAFAENTASADATANAKVETEADTGFFGKTWAGVKGLFGADEEVEHNQASQEEQPESEKAYSQGQKERADAAREDVEAHVEQSHEMVEAHGEQAMKIEKAQEQHARGHAVDATESANEHGHKLVDTLKATADQDVKAGVNADVGVQVGTP